jgi:hypothetical protein
MNAMPHENKRRRRRVSQRFPQPAGKKQTNPQVIANAKQQPKKQREKEEEK